MVIVIITLGLAHGEQMIKMVVVNLICEFSSIFLNNRTIMGKYLWKGFYANLNAIIFFISYIFLRLILFPLCVYSAFAQNKFIPKKHWTTATETEFWAIMVIFVFIWLLNVHWFKLLFKGLMKVINGEGEKSQLQEENIPLVK